MIWHRKSKNLAKLVCCWNSIGSATFISKDLFMHDNMEHTGNRESRSCLAICVFWRQSFFVASTSSRTARHNRDVPRRWRNTYSNRGSRGEKTGRGVVVSGRTGSYIQVSELICCTKTHHFVPTFQGNDRRTCSQNINPLFVRVLTRNRMKNYYKSWIMDHSILSISIRKIDHDGSWFSLFCFWREKKKQN